MKPKLKIPVLLRVYLITKPTADVRLSAVGFYLQILIFSHSAGNRGVVQSRLQVLHVHVFLVAPLGARHMAEPGADQHQGGISIRERPHHPRPAADLPVQPLDHVVGADARPVLAGEIAVGQRLLNAVLDLFGGLLQLHGAQLGNHGLCLFAGRFFALLGVDRLEHFCHNFGLGFGHNRENIAVEIHRAALVYKT